MTTCYFLVFLKTNKTFLKHCNIPVGFFFFFPHFSNYFLSSSTFPRHAELCDNNRANPQTCIIPKYFLEVSSSIMLCTVSIPSSAVHILHFITDVKLELILPFFKNNKIRTTFSI